MNDLWAAQEHHRQQESIGQFNGFHLYPDERDEFQGENGKGVPGPALRRPLYIEQASAFPRQTR